MRGLRALGVPTDSYELLLTSILKSKLPSEIRIVVSRELTRELQEMGKVMKIVSREV